MKTPSSVGVDPVYPPESIACETVFRDMNALDVYPWTGHRTLMGYCQNPLIYEMKLPSTSYESGSSFGSLAEKTVGDVLRRKRS